MKLEIKRIAKKAKYTIGKLYVDGAYFCDTLEDTDRGLDSSMTITDIKRQKVDGKTAIPTGTYTITLGVKSPKFSKKTAYAFCGGFLPRLLNVPGYEGVLIHIGNTAEDTEGCLLVGKNKAVGKVLESTATFTKLYTILKKADQAGETIKITIL